MGYFKELLNRELQRPSKDIAIIDRNEVYQQSVRFIIERTKNSFAKYNLKVKGTNGIKYYKGKSKLYKHVIYTIGEEPIFNIEDCNVNNIRKNIYLGKYNNNLIGSIHSRQSDRKYRVEYTNLFTGEKEYLEMHSDKRLVICGIYYGKEKEGAPLIAKITRDRRISTKCVLDIAPGVDNIFFMGLAAFFSDRAQFRNKKRKTKSSHKKFDLSDDEDDDDVDDYDGGDYDACGYGSYHDCDGGGDGGDGGDGGGDCGGGDGGGGD